MVLGVSVSMLCFSFGTFTVHTKFCCTHHSSQDKQWTISSYVSQTFCFKTQTMDNILNLLKVQPIAETFLDFTSSLNCVLGHFLPNGSDQSDETNDIEWDKNRSIHLFLVFCSLSVFRRQIVSQPTFNRSLHRIQKSSAVWSSNVFL